MATIEQTELNLEQALNVFDATARRQALQELLVRRPPAGTLPAVANMHCHTFFSFNAYGYSPSGLAWLARQRGIGLMGIVDFDVLDAVDEFLDACELVAVRGSAGIETRTFVPEFADREINSPGEPGVYYHMGIGFTTAAAPPEGQAILRELREQSARRNRRLVVRVNDYLAPVAVDYDADVLPLTPAGNATERHIVVAYIRAADATLREPALYWADKLGMERSETEAMLADSASFQNLLRNKLMKRGGPGYIQPGNDTFPPVEKLHALASSCGAMPCATWLDGTTPGEQTIDELLALLIAKGVVAINIVPDRNWNIADPQQRALKQHKLYEIVQKAEELALPINVGTEMNSFGQKIVDDFDAHALAPVRAAFIDGAYFIYGHTLLQRVCGLGYQSAWAHDQLSERRERNAFFVKIGKRVPPGVAGRRALQAVRGDMGPADVLAVLEA